MLFWSTLDYNHSKFFFNNFKCYQFFLSLSSISLISKSKRYEALLVRLEMDVGGTAQSGHVAYHVTN